MRLYCFKDKVTGKLMIRLGEWQFFTLEQYAEQVEGKRKQQYIA